MKTSQKLKFILKNSPLYLLTRVLPYISRLPLIEDYFTDNLYHYKNRRILIFKLSLEGSRRREKIEVFFLEGDQYHLTFFIRLVKPLTLSQAKNKINQVIKSCFEDIGENVIVKLAGREGKILIPRDMLEYNQRI